MGKTYKEQLRLKAEVEKAKTLVEVGAKHHHYKENTKSTRF